MMDMDIHIRSVKRSDLEAILEIERLNFPDLAADASSILERIERISDTFYVITYQNELVAYAEGPVIDLDVPLTPFFEAVEKNRSTGGYIFLTSVSVHPAYQNQGYGTLILATLKEVVSRDKRAGLFLLCKEEKMVFYEQNAFSFRGVSDSNFGGETWIEMIWENPNDREKYED